MATTHGKDSTFKIDNGAGTLTDISASVNSVDFSWESEVAESTTMGSEAKTYISGLTDATFSIGGVWDDAASTGGQTVLSTLPGKETSSSFEWGPEGSATGAVKYSGECWLTSYTESAPVGDIVAFTADFQVTATITIGTFV